MQLWREYEANTSSPAACVKTKMDPKGYIDNWQKGDIAVTQPDNAEALRGVYTDPGGNKHYSKWLVRARAGKLAFAIGPNLVYFGVQEGFSFPEDSAKCQAEPKPKVTFTEGSYEKFIDQGAIDPFKSLPDFYYWHT